MRSAVTYRDAKTLRRTDGDVGTELTGRNQQGQLQQIALRDGDTATLVDHAEYFGRIP